MLLYKQKNILPYKQKNILPYKQKKKKNSIG